MIIIFNQKYVAGRGRKVHMFNKNLFTASNYNCNFRKHCKRKNKNASFKKLLEYENNGCLNN